MICMILCTKDEIKNIIILQEHMPENSGSVGTKLWITFIFNPYGLKMDGGLLIMRGHRAAAVMRVFYYYYARMHQHRL